MNIKHIGFVGVGVIATPMIKSLLRQFPNTQIVLSPRNNAVTAELAASHDAVSIAASNQAVLDHCEHIFVCLLANVAKEVLPALKFRGEHKVVSVMVDYSHQQLLNDCAPATEIAITIPLPFVEYGNCPLAAYPYSPLLEHLYGKENQLITAPDENSLLPFISVTGVVSALIAELNAIAQWLGNCVGNAEKGEQYTLGMMANYLSSLDHDGKSRLQAVLKDLSTEGGLNTQFLEHIRSSGHLENLHTGLEQLNQRLGYNK